MAKDYENGILLFMSIIKETKQERSLRKSRERVVKKFILLIIGLAALVALIFGVVWSAQQSGTTSGPQTVKVDLASITADDHVLGTPGGVTLIEYSDFQCPACAAYEPLVKEVVADFRDDLLFVYRHYPLPQHQNARLAAQVSEAAAVQGKFWEISTLMFANQTAWASQSPTTARVTFASYASELGLDMNRFEADLVSEAVAERVERDYLSGVQARVSGTPTFYLDGVEVKARTAGEFADLIEAAIKTKNNEPNSSTTTQTTVNE